MNQQDLHRLQAQAKQKAKENKAFLAKLKKQKPKDLDLAVVRMHNAAFDEVDCLECANCCRSLGPRLTDTDIARLAKHLKQKPSAFVEQYLRVDEDKDYVFKEMPCPFLMHDNYCAVYPQRPKACREYPHTDRKKFYQIAPLAAINAETCPAVYSVVEQLKAHYGN